MQLQGIGIYLHLQYSESPPFPSVSLSPQSWTRCRLSVFTGFGGGAVVSVLWLLRLVVLSFALCFTFLLPVPMGACIFLPHGLLRELQPLWVPYSMVPTVGLLAF